MLLYVNTPSSSHKDTSPGGMVTVACEHNRGSHSWQGTRMQIGGCSLCCVVLPLERGKAGGSSSANIPIGICNANHGRCSNGIPNAKSWRCRGIPLCIVNAKNGRCNVISQYTTVVPTKTTLDGGGPCNSLLLPTGVISHHARSVIARGSARSLDEYIIQHTGKTVVEQIRIHRFVCTDQPEMGQKFTDSSASRLPEMIRVVSAGAGEHVPFRRRFDDTGCP